MAVTAALAGLLVTGFPGRSTLGVASAAREPAPVPTTTITTAPPPAPTTTTPPPPSPPAAPPAAPATQKRGILPPSEPPANIPPSPNFLNSCNGTQYDDSPGCLSAVVNAIDNGRAQEGLPAFTLPGNWAQLSVEQQLFVSTNLERTARGLPALRAMADVLDQAAEQGAAQSVDPSAPAGFPSTEWGSNWAGAVGNPLEAMYYWMYDDGLGSSNIDCTQSNQTGCWGHRENVLINLSCQMCVMGTGYDATGWQGDPSMAEILADSSGQPALSFTWQQEQAYL